MSSRGATLLRRFVKEAKGVAPSKLRELEVLRAIHTASPDVQMDVVEECIRAYPAGTHPRTELGKYADIALNDLFLPLLRDAALPFSVQRARALLSGAHVLPRTGIVKVFERLAEQNGWTEELRSIVLESDVLRALHASAHDPLPRAGDAWAQVARSEIEATTSAREAWTALLTFLSRNPPAFEPDDRWTAEVAKLRGPLGEDFRSHVVRWLEQTAVSVDVESARAKHNARLLHGLVAMLDARDRRVLVHVARVAFSPIAAGLYLPKLGYRVLRILRDEPQMLAELAPALPRRAKMYAFG